MDFENISTDMLERTVSGISIRRVRLHSKTDPDWVRAFVNKYRGKLDYGATLRGQTLPVQFENLIIDLHRQFNEKAVVIIDEYDKPLTDTLGKRDLHIELRNALKEFYGVLKSCDAHLRFIFITGVSRFSQVSIFSGLNQLTDLTFDPRYADLCGLTQEELEADFGPEIDRVIENTKRSREGYLDELRRFYGGYRFSETPLTAYNPSSLQNHFYNRGSFNNYWYASGTPSFLVRLIEEKKIDIKNMNIDNIRARLNSFGIYELDGMSSAVALYQTGYLTISDYNAESGIYTLDFPNEEVRASFAESLTGHCR